MEIISKLIEMGNNIVSSVMKVFDRSHSEIESISARIDRAQIKGIREKHEIYLDNIGIYESSSVKFMESRKNVSQVKHIEIQNLFFSLQINFNKSDQ